MPVMSCILMQLAGCFSGKDTRAMATSTRLPFLGSGGPCSTSTGALLVPKANTSLPLGGFNGQRLQHGGLDLQGPWGMFLPSRSLNTISSINPQCWGRFYGYGYGFIWANKKGQQWGAARNCLGYIGNHWD